MTNHNQSREQQVDQKTLQLETLLLQIAEAAQKQKKHYYHDFARAGIKSVV